MLALLALAAAAVTFLAGGLYLSIAIGSEGNAGLAEAPSELGTGLS